MIIEIKRIKIKVMEIGSKDTKIKIIFIDYFIDIYLKTPQPFIRLYVAQIAMFPILCGIFFSIFG